MKETTTITDFKDLRKIIGEVTTKKPAKTRYQQQAEKMGYHSAADLRAGYPKFFWELVSPYISEGIKFLRRTQTGQAWVQNLYANVFKEEHDTEVYGPERAGNRN